MSAMDRFNKLKAQLDYVNRYDWCYRGNVMDHAELYLDSCGRTRQEIVSDADKKEFNWMCSSVEHEHSADISWCLSYAIGKALKEAVVRQLTRAMKVAAAEAEKEARAIVAAIDSGELT